MYCGNKYGATISCLSGSDSGVLVLGLFCSFSDQIMNQFSSDGLIHQPISSRDLRKSDANGFVQKAISAANVYNNIVKYIDDANITSLTTFNLSQRVEDVCNSADLQYSSAVLQCSSAHMSVF